MLASAKFSLWLANAKCTLISWIVYNVTLQSLQVISLNSRVFVAISLISSIFSLSLTSSGLVFFSAIVQCNGHTSLSFMPPPGCSVSPQYTCLFHWSAYLTESRGTLCRLRRKILRKELWIEEEKLWIEEKSYELKKRVMNWRKNYELKKRVMNWRTYCRLIEKRTSLNACWSPFEPTRNSHWALFH